MTSGENCYLSKHLCSPGTRVLDHNFTSKTQNSTSEKAVQVAQLGKSSAEAIEATVVAVQVS